jgi:hypothetical protein
VCLSLACVVISLTWAPPVPPPCRLRARHSLSLSRNNHRHETKLSRDLEEKTIVEETAKRIESYVQKRVRQELESESFLITLQKKIDEAKKALTDKMLGSKRVATLKAPP